MADCAWVDKRMFCTIATSAASLVIKCFLNLLQTVVTYRDISLNIGDVHMQAGHALYCSAHLRKVNMHARSYLGCIFFRCKTAAQQNHKLLWWPKVVSHERTDETSPMSLTPEEPFSEETIQAIADCVVKQLQRFVSSC